jgi:phosphatidylglycerophosphate synthase
MDYNKLTWKYLRQLKYDEIGEECPYIYEFFKNPYTWIKVRFFIELGAIFLYIFLRTPFSANAVTTINIVLGILGGVLLAVKIKWVIIVGLVIFFSKNVFDYCDGSVARFKKQTSLTGAIIDPYSALIGSLAFQVGLGFYVAHRLDMMIFYYLVPIIPLCFAGRFHAYAYYVIFVEHLNAKTIHEYRQRFTETDQIDEAMEQPTQTLSRRYGKLADLVRNFFDDRARTTDLICLFVLIELYTDLNITWLFFLAFVLRQSAIFVASFYSVTQQNLVEEVFENRMKDIIGQMNKES